MRIYEVTIVEPKARPQVVHQDGEASHDSQHTPRTTKFIARRALSEKNRACELWNVLVVLVQCRISFPSNVADFDNVRRRAVSVDIALAQTVVGHSGSCCQK